MYDDILDTIIRITDKKLLHFKLSNSGQILCVDRTGSPRPWSHVMIIHIHMYGIIFLVPGF